MKFVRAYCLLLLVICVFLPPAYSQENKSATSSLEDSLRLNQTQVIGSHNSYHAGMGKGEMQFLRLRDPKAADSLDYSHPPLAIQFDEGVRQIEIDVYA